MTWLSSQVLQVVWLALQVVWFALQVAWLALQVVCRALQVAWLPMIINQPGIYCLTTILLSPRQRSCEGI